MRNIKRFICLLMATATVTNCFTGCGENASKDAGAGAEIIDAGAEATVVAASTEGSENKPVSKAAGIKLSKFEGNNIIYISYDDSDNETMCVYDMSTGEECKLNTTEGNPADYTKPSIEIVDCYSNAEGNVVELINETRVNVDEFDFKPESITEDDVKKLLVSEWGASEEDLEDILDEDGERAKRYIDSEGKLHYDWIYVSNVGYKYSSTGTSKLVTYDMSGKAVNTIELGTTENNDEVLTTFVSCGQDKDGNSLVLGYEKKSGVETVKYTITAFDAQGAKKYSCDFDGNSQSYGILPSADGTTKLGFWSDRNTYTIADFDASNGTVNVVGNIQDQICLAGTLKDANTFIYTNGSGLFSCDLVAGKRTTLANLAEYGIQEYALEAVGVMEDGSVVGFVVSKSETDETVKTDIVKF